MQPNKTETKKEKWIFRKPFLVLFIIAVAISLFTMFAIKFDKGCGIDTDCATSAQNLVFGTDFFAYLMNQFIITPLAIVFGIIYFFRTDSRRTKVIMIVLELILIVNLLFLFAAL